MTIRSSARMAVARDQPAEAPKGSPQTEQTSQVESGVDRLAAAVPADVIVLYTTVLGVLASSLTDGDGTYLPLRWYLYFGSILAILVSVPLAYRLQRQRREAGADAPRRLPVAETVTALWAFGVWGLVIPESPLYVMMEPPTLPVVIGCLTAVGVYVLTGVLGPLLSRPAKPVQAQEQPGATLHSVSAEPSRDRVGR